MPHAQNEHPKAASLDIAAVEALYSLALLAADARQTATEPPHLARKRSPSPFIVMQAHLSHATACFTTPVFCPTAILPFAAPIGLSAVTAYTFSINACLRGYTGRVQRLYRLSSKYSCCDIAILGDGG